jgi:hypothetical protein
MVSLQSVSLRGPELHPRPLLAPAQSPHRPPTNNKGVAPTHPKPPSVRRLGALMARRARSTCSCVDVSRVVQ